MKLNTIIQLVALFFVGKCLGQSCGVTAVDQYQWSPRYNQNLAKHSGIQKRTLAEVPIIFHLVSRQNGVGRASLKEALSLLCQLNNDFQDVAISFFLSENGVNFINDDGIFTSPQLAINKLAMQKHKVPTAINVFVVNKINDNGAIGIYEQSEDWVLVQKSAFLSGNKTLSHEIGHYFSLYHPHFGWESAPWTTSKDGSMVSALSPDGKTETENMNGVNCYLAGDKLCDTAPDYNFGLNWQQSCAFSGIALDPNGTRVNPDETLIMSYFNDSCRNTFTQEQIGMMRADLTSDFRQFLFSQGIPPNLPLSGTSKITSPSGLATLSGKDSITFSWDVVNNASYYYLEVDRSSNFNLDPKGVIVRENHIDFAQNWISGIKYYARIFSWSEQNTCLAPSGTIEFEVTNVSANDNYELQKNIQFYNLNGAISVDYKDLTPGSYIFHLYNLNGDLICRKPIQMGKNGEKMPVYDENLQPGIYVINLFGNHNFSQKILIMK